MPHTYPDPARTDPVPPSLTRTDNAVDREFTASFVRNELSSGGRGGWMMIGITIVLLVAIGAVGFVLLFPDLTWDARSTGHMQARTPPGPAPLVSPAVPATPATSPPPKQTLEQPRGFDVHPLDQPAQAPVPVPVPPPATAAAPNLPPVGAPPPQPASAPVQPAFAAPPTPIVNVPPPPSVTAAKPPVPPKPRRHAATATLPPVHLHPPTSADTQSATNEPRSQPGEAPPIDAGDLPPPEPGSVSPSQ